MKTGDRDPRVLVVFSVSLRNLIGEFARSVAVLFVVGREGYPTAFRGRFGLLKAGVPLGDGREHAAAKSMQNSGSSFLARCSP